MDENGYQIPIIWFEIFDLIIIWCECNILEPITICHELDYGIV
jgi:hypothetical protein